MALEDRFEQMFAMEKELRNRLTELREHGAPSGGGGSGPVDDRINRLEGRIDKVGDELGEVKVNLATLTERVAHLPGKGFMASTLIGGLTLFGAFIVFADNIKKLIG